MHPFDRWIKASQTIAQIGFFSSTILCFLLIVLTLFGVKRNFGSYKNFLILFPTVGIFFATVEILLYPHIHSFDASCVFFSTSRLFNLEADTITMSLAFYTGVYATTISMLSAQFLYRYWAIFDKRKLWYFKKWRFLIIIALCVYVGVQWGTGLHVFAKIDKYALDYMRSELKEKYGILIDETPAMSLVAYDADGNLRWWNQYSTVNMTAIMIVHYTIIIYCAYFMWKEMEEKLQIVSKSLRTLHKQFFKTLILQIICPTICLFCPVTFIIYLPLLDIKVNLPTGMFLCSLTLYPAMDSIIVMYIVTDYRHAAKKIIRNMRLHIINPCYVTNTSNVVSVDLNVQPVNVTNVNISA